MVFLRIHNQKKRTQATHSTFSLVFFLFPVLLPVDGAGGTTTSPPATSTSPTLVTPLDRSASSTSCSSSSPSCSSSSSSVKFVAVQHGIGLQSSAIFFSWNDAKPFVTVGSGSCGSIGDNEEGKETDETTTSIDGNNNVKYQTFSTIDEAVQYLTGKHDNNYIPDSNGKKRKTSAIALTTNTTATTTTPTTTTTNPKRQRRHKKVTTATTTTIATTIKTPLTRYVNRIKQSEFDKMMVQLQHFKDQYHHVKVPGPFSKKVPVDIKYTTLRSWMAMVRHAVRQYQEDRRYCPLTDLQMIQLVDIGFIPRSTIRMDNTTTTTTTATTATKHVAGAARSSRNRNVRTTKDDEDDDDGTTTRFVITSTVHGCGVSGSGSNNNNSGMGDSNRWKTPTSAHNLLKLKDELEGTWEDRIKLLQTYKQVKGHAHVPKRPNKSLDDVFVPLCKFAGWMQKFLEEYYDAKDRSHFFLTPDRVQQLHDLGFKCTTPSTRVNGRHRNNGYGGDSTLDGGANNDENTNFEEMLVELKRIKQVHAPIKTNRQLEWWITEQRKQYALFKANQPSTITPERIAVMAEAGFPFEKTKSPTWDERAVEWLEFKTKMGRDPMREESLYQWVYKQRVKYKQKRNGDGKRNNLTPEQIKYVPA
jgi:hypothetical protein